MQISKTVITSIICVGFLTACTKAPDESEAISSLRIELYDHDLNTGELTKAVSGEFLNSPMDGVVFRNNDDDDNDGLPDDEDERVNGESDRFDMTKIHIAGLHNNTDAQLVFSKDAAGNFRAFLAPDMSVLDLTSPINFGKLNITADEVSIYLEATQFAGPDFDGEIELTIESQTKQTLTLKVAPWLMLSNASKAETLLIREYVGGNDVMLEQLNKVLPKANVALNVIPASAPYDAFNIWLQDTIEIGRQFKPNTSMPVVLQANRNKSIDHFSKAELLSANFGWMNIGEYREAFARGEADNGQQPKTPEWIDWFGNLEVSPPLPNYPHGRVYFGENAPGEQLDPKIIAMIDAQQLQGPAFKLDVSFLMIKHADEVVSFVPSGDPDQPWYALVPSPKAFIELAVAWRDQGHGDLPLLDRFESNYTVNAFLADSELVEHNWAIEQGALVRNKQILMRELGLPADAIIEIPVAFKRNGTSLTPNMVNSAMVNGHFLVPDPNGPLVEGNDLLQQAFVDILTFSPIDITFIDDRQYHAWWGNVHCATNVIRAGEEHLVAF